MKPIHRQDPMWLAHNLREYEKEEKKRLETVCYNCLYRGVEVWNGIYVCDIGCVFDDRKCKNVRVKK